MTTATTPKTAAAVQKSVDKAVEKETVVTVTRTDGKTFTGKLVKTDDGRLSVRTGRGGRPAVIGVEDITDVVTAA